METRNDHKEKSNLDHCIDKDNLGEISSAILDLFRPQIKGERLNFASRSPLNAKIHPPKAVSVLFQLEVPECGWPLAE